MTEERTPAKVRLTDGLGPADEVQPLLERAAFEAWFLARYSYTRAVLTNPIWAREIADAEEAFAAGRAAEREWCDKIAADGCLAPPDGPLRCDGCGKTIADHDRLLRCVRPNVANEGPPAFGRSPRLAG